MNKYIKTDIQQGITFLRIAINNALSDIESGEEKEIRLEAPIALQLIIECAEERGWEEDMDDWDWTNGWEVDYWYKMIHPDKNIRLSVSGSLIGGYSTIISIRE